MHLWFICFYIDTYDNLWSYVHVCMYVCMYVCLKKRNKDLSFPTCVLGSRKDRCLRRCGQHCSWNHWNCWCCQARGRKTHSQSQSTFINSYLHTWLSGGIYSLTRHMFVVLWRWKTGVWLHSSAQGDENRCVDAYRYIHFTVSTQEWNSLPTVCSSEYVPVIDLKKIMLSKCRWQPNNSWNLGRGTWGWLFTVSFIHMYIHTYIYDQLIFYRY